MPTGPLVEVTRLELSAARLRRGAARNRDADPAWRLLAVALVLEGKGRKKATPLQTQVNEQAGHRDLRLPVSAT